MKRIIKLQMLLMLFQKFNIVERIVHKLKFPKYIEKIPIFYYV